jgi:hypothetical protein
MDEEQFRRLRNQVIRLQLLGFDGDLSHREVLGSFLLNSKDLPALMKVSQLGLAN